MIQPPKLGVRCEHAGEIAVSRSDLKTSADQHQATYLVGEPTCNTRRKIASVRPAEYSEGSAVELNLDGSDDRVEDCIGSWWAVCRRVTGTRQIDIEATPTGYFGESRLDRSGHGGVIKTERGQHDERITPIPIYLEVKRHRS
jgi:hypothetical protein